MYRYKKATTTSLKVNEAYAGERIEEKIFRITTSKEPITDSAPLIYTDRKDGVQPDYNIRTDRFDAAIDAMDYIARTHTAKREQRIGERTYDTMTTEQQKKFNEKFPNNKHNKQPGTGANTNDSK